MLKRLVAGLLAWSLVLASPGLGGYEALGQVARVPASGAGVVPVSAAAASAAAAQASFAAFPLFLPVASPLGGMLVPGIFPAPSGLEAPGSLPPGALPESVSAIGPSPAVLSAGPAASSLAAAQGLAESLSPRTPGALPSDDEAGLAVEEAFDGARKPKAGGVPGAGSAPGTPGRVNDMPVEASLRPAAAPEAAPGADSAPGTTGRVDDMPVAPEAGPPAPAGKTKLPRGVWGDFIGHDLLAAGIGVEIHILSQPFLIMKTLAKSEALMGLARNVHMGVFSIANFLPIGLLVDKTDFRVLLVVTALARGLLMGLIPVLYLAGTLSGTMGFSILLAILAINPFFQAPMVLASVAARKAFLGTDEKLNKEATAVLTKYSSIAGVFLPLAMSLTLSLLITTFGLGGYAMAYTIYSAALFLSAPIFWFTMKDPRDPKDLGWAGFREFLRETGKFMGALVKGLVLSPFWLLRAGWRAFRKWLDRVRGRSGPTEAAAGGLAGRLENLAKKLDGYEATKGAAYVLRNKVLRVLLGVGAIEAFLADAMPMIVLPKLVTDAIGELPGDLPGLGVRLAGAAGLFAFAWTAGRLGRWWKARRGGEVHPSSRTNEVLTALMLLGTAAFLPTMLASAGGIFGLLLLAEYFGHYVSAAFMEGERGDRLMQRWGHGRFYRIAAVGSLLFWLMWLFPSILTPGVFWVNLGVVFAVQFLLQVFHGPVGIVMAPIQRREIPEPLLGRVESAFDVVLTAFMAAGALAAGIVIDLFSVGLAMFLMSLAITATAVLEWKTPGWIFPDGNHPAPKPEEPPKTAWLGGTPALAFA